jgi:hypothetical protein
MAEPVLLTADSSDDSFIHEHVAHFFNTRCLEASKSLTQEERERYYKYFTENEELIIKVFGEGLSKSKVFVPVALRNGVDNFLTYEYKQWLEKQ